MSEDISLFCLYDPGHPPAVFKKINDESQKFSCSLPLKCLQQLLIFTQGQWREGTHDASIEITHCGKGKKQKICTLTKTQSCFQWTEFDKLTGSAKITLEASFLNPAVKSQENKEPSTPPITKIPESEEMRKQNETTPQAEATVDAQSTLPTKPSKKRGRDEETTPKPKSRRQKVAMRALAPEKTPPAKQKLLEITPSTNQMIQETPVEKEVSSNGKVTRCVDLSARAPKPSCRWGHTMCLVNSNQAVLIGGQSEKQLSRDSIWYLDPEMRCWRCPEVITEGAKPEYRMGHSATYDSTMRCIYIYGGSKNAKWFHDVHMFDLDEKKWTLVKANGKAPTRSYHSATLYRHEIWIFGGVFPRPDPQPDGCDNEIQIFSPVMESWYKPIVTGEKPQPRSGHSATLINDLLVVFGGWDFPYCYNDLFILDLTTVDWSSPKVYGQPPKPRSWHASCALTNERVFIHGGYDGDNALHDAHIFDLVNKTWFQLALQNAPSARAGHACMRLHSDYENQDEDEVMVFGGGDNDGSYFSDMLSFYVPHKPQTVKNP